MGWKIINLPEISRRERLSLGCSFNLRLPLEWASTVDQSGEQEKMFIIFLNHIDKKQHKR